MAGDFDLKDAVTKIENAATGAFAACDVINLNVLLPQLETLNRSNIGTVAAQLSNYNSNDDVTKPTFELKHGGEDNNVTAIVFHGGYLAGCTKDRNYTYDLRPWQRRYDAD